MVSRPLNKWIRSLKNIHSCIFNRFCRIYRYARLHLLQGYMSQSHNSSPPFSFATASAAAVASASTEVHSPYSALGIAAFLLLHFHLILFAWMLALMNSFLAIYFSETLHLHQPDWFPIKYECMSISYSPQLNNGKLWCKGELLVILLNLKQCCRYHDILKYTFINGVKVLSVY